MTNVEFAKKLLENETISENFTFETILAELDMTFDDANSCPSETDLQTWIDGYLAQLDASNTTAEQRVMLKNVIDNFDKIDDAKQKKTSC